MNLCLSSFPPLAISLPEKDDKADRGERVTERTPGKAEGPPHDTRPGSPVPKAVGRA